MSHDCSPCGLYYHLEGMKVLAPYSAFFDAFLGGGRVLKLLITAWRGCKLCSPRWPSLLWGRVEPPHFSALFGWSTVIFSKRFPSFHVAHFLALWLTRANFSWGCFCLHHWCFQVAGFLSAKSEIYEAKRKPSVLTLMFCLGSWGL